MPAAAQRANGNLPSPPSTSNALLYLGTTALSVGAEAAYRHLGVDAHLHAKPLIEKAQPVAAFATDQFAKLPSCSTLLEKLPSWEAIAAKMPGLPGANAEKVVVDEDNLPEGWKKYEWGYGRPPILGNNVEPSPSQTAAQESTEQTEGIFSTFQGRFQGFGDCYKVASAYVANNQDWLITTGGVALTSVAMNHLLSNRIKNPWARRTVALVAGTAVVMGVSTLLGDTKGNFLVDPSEVASIGLRCMATQTVGFWALRQASNLTLAMTGDFQPVGTAQKGKN